MWIKPFADLPDDILGHVISMCDLKLCFRQSLVCKYFRDSFVWSNIKNFDLCLSKSDQETITMFNSLLQHLPLLRQVDTLCLVWVNDWPQPAELAEQIQRFIRTLAPTLRQVKLSLPVNCSSQSEEFFSRCTPSILEKLDIDGDFVDYIVRLPSLSRLRAVSLKASSHERFVRLLEGLASKTGSLEQCEFAYRYSTTEINGLKYPEISAAIRRLTGANSRMTNLWVDPACLHPSYTVLASFFGLETNQHYLPPEMWHLIPEKISSAWGLAPTQCRAHYWTFWDSFVLNSLQQVLETNQSFTPDPEMLDFLHDQLVSPTSENQGLTRLINILLNLANIRHAAIDPMLLWAERRVLQLMARRSWGCTFIAEALVVLGARLILPKQTSESIERSESHCREVLSGIEHPFNLMSKVTRFGSLSKDSLFRAILDCGIWCSSVERRIISLPPETIYHMTRDASQLRSFLFHPTFCSNQTARINTETNQLVAEVLLVEYLKVLSSLTLLADSRLARDCLGQLLNICVSNHVTIACPTNLSISLVMLLLPNLDLSRQFAHVIDSPLRLFQAFRGTADQFSQRTLELLKIVLETFERERTDVNAVTKQAIRHQSAEAIWRAIFADNNLKRVSFEDFVRIIEPAVAIFGALPFLAEFATNPSASSCIGVDFSTKEANVFKQGIIVCFSKLLGLGLMV